MTGTKDEIDWSHVAPEFKAMARDEDGQAWLYDVEPFPDSVGQWLLTGDLMSGANAFASYKRGTCDWRDSLVRRPE